MSKIYIGVDNGVTGSIGIVSEDFCDFILTPVRKEQNYTKKKDLINRIDVNVLRDYLTKSINGHEPQDCLAVLERPLVNPTMFKATISAVRALEATMGVLESLHIPYMFTDSKEWQRKVLPQGTQGTPELKKASVDIGCRLYPKHEVLIKKHKDADGLLIAYNAYREKY